MGRFNLGNLRTRIRDLLNEDSADFWTNAQIDRLINDAERDIAMHGQCINNIDAATTVINTRTVAFAGYNVLHVEYSTAGLGLPEILPNQLGRITPDGATPQKWFENGSSVGIDPLPDAAYPLNLYIADYPTSEMAADATEPQIPEHFQLLIVLHAYGNALKKEKRIQQATQVLGMYNNELMFTRADIIEFQSESKGEYASDRSASRSINK